jgi:formylglycine-generating enzyme required for sulfatase activity
VCDPGYQPWGASCVALAQGGDGGATGDGVDSGQSTDGGVDDSGDVDGSVDRDSGGGDAVPPTVPGTWVLIDASGTPFTMGSPLDELGRYSNEVEHDVTLTRNYWMMTTEVTQQQFLDQMGYNPSFYSLDGAGPDCGLDCPVEQVNWHEVAAYANGLSRWEGLAECYSCTGTAPDTIDCRPSGSYATAYECPGYRLPTEAEWEYAARGGTTTATYAGDLTATSCFDATLIPIAWFCGNAGRTTHPVGTRSPNAYELYDMLGNVGEWCHDWHDAYPGGPEVDPPGAASGMSRVRRGSSCDGTGEFSRAAYRGYGPPDNRAMQNGVRLVRSSP